MRWELYFLSAGFFLWAGKERRKAMKIFKRIKVYFFLKNLGINHPWKASGDKSFITFG